MNNKITLIILIILFALIAIPMTFSKKEINENIIPAPRPQMKALLNKFNVPYEQGEEVFYKWNALVNEKMGECGGITLKNVTQNNIIGKINSLLLSGKCNDN